MKLPEFLFQDDCGEIFLTGHRIGLKYLVHYYNEGYSPEMLLDQFPALRLAQVHKAIAFYLENQADVDAYVARSDDELNRQRSAGRHVDVQALRERLRQLQKTEATLMGQRNGPDVPSR